MKIAFTLCSVNYLPQAKALGDSLMKHNPDYIFIIGLVDRVEDRSKISFTAPFEVLEVEKLNIEGFEQMYEYYNIVELNTAVKPFYIEHLLARFSSADFVIYFDPDILIFDRLTYLEERLKENNIVLTPHCITPIDNITTIDRMTPNFAEKVVYYEERVMLYVGVFNLGFIAISNTPEGKRCARWWGERLRHQCYIGGSRNYLGLFTDQVWMNFAPIYFEKVHIMKHTGYNMAPWNLHERRIVEKEGKFYVNNSDMPLVFFHFSGYSHATPDMVTKWMWMTFTERPDLKPLFQLYRTLLDAYNYSSYIKIECFFIRKKREDKERQKALEAEASRVTFAQQPLRASFRLAKKIMPSSLKDMIKKPIAFLYRISHPGG